MSTITNEINMAYSSLRTQNLQQSQKSQEVRETEEKETQAAAPKGVSPSMDVVEISAAGRQAAVPPSGGTEETAGESTSSSSAAAFLSALEEEDATESSVFDTLLEDDDSSVTSSEIYTLSESELKTLVTEGTITRVEMETELTRRNGGAAAVSSADA